MGNAGAQYNLGLTYKHGNDVPKDITKGYPFIPSRIGLVYYGLFRRRAVSSSIIVLIGSRLMAVCHIR